MRIITENCESRLEPTPKFHTKAARNFSQHDPVRTQWPDPDAGH
jgi:hypothetical protein